MENESFAFQEESRSSLMDVTPAPIRPMPSQPSSSSAAVMGGGVPSGAPPKPPLPTAPTSAVAPPLFSDEESIHFFMEGGTSTGMRTPIHFSSHPPPSSASPASAPRPRAATNTTTTTTTTTSHQHNLNRTKSGALVRDMSDSLLFQLESPADGRAEASSVSPERDGRPSLLLGGGGGVGGGGSDAFTVDSLNFVVEDEGGAASRMSGTRHRHRGRRSTSHRPGGGGSTVLNDSLAFAFTDDDGSAIRRAVAPLRQAYTPSLAFEEEDLESARQEELLASAMMRRTPASPSPATGTNNTRSDEKKTVVSNHLRRASRTSSPSPRVKASTSAAAVSGATSQRAEASHTGGVVEQSSSISFQSMPTFEAHRKLDLASPDVGGSPAPRAQAEGQQPCTPERPPVAVSASAAAAAGASSSTGKRRETEPSSPRTAPFTDVSPRRSASRKDEAIRDHLRDQETSNTVYRHPPPLQPTQQQKDVVGGGGDVPSAGVKSKTSGNSSGSPRPSTRSASRVGKSALRERSPHTAHARVSTKVFGEEATTVAVAQVETQQWKAFNAQQRAEVMQLVERIQHARDMDATLLGRTSMEEGGTAAETRRRLQRTMKKKRTTTTHDEDDDVHPRTKEAIHATITLRPTPTAALAIPPRLPTTISSAMDRGCSTMEAAEAVARLLGIQWPPHSDELHNMYFITGSRLTMEQAEHFYESVRLHQERATAMRSSTRAALSSDGGAGRISPLPAPLRPTEKSVAATSSAEAARRRSLALHPRTTTTSVKVPKRTAVLRQVFDVLDVQRCGFLRAADLPVLQHLVEEELLLMDRQSQQRAHGPEHTSLLHSAQEQHQVRFSTVDATRHGTCATTTTTTTTSSSTAAARLRRRSLQLSFAVNVLLPMAVASEIHRIDFPTLCMLIFSAVDAKSAAHSGEDQAWRDVVGQYFEALC